MISSQYLVEVKLKREAVPSFQTYPFHLDAVRSMSSVPLHPKVTYFVGENGSGKSTLLEAIAIAWGFNPEGGSKNFSFGTYLSHSDLHKFLQLSRGIKKPKDGFFLRAESFFNVATEIERLDEGPGGASVIDSYGGTSLHAQSHGESFFALFLHRFAGKGFYILDEPEAALSPMRQMAILTRMHQLIEAESQFIIATHSPIVLAYPDAQIYQLGSEGPAPVNYKETEHYRMSRNFLSRPEHFLDLLLAGDDVS